MKKLTSKSVSEAHGTSLRYGASDRTADTAKKKKATKARTKEASGIFAAGIAAGAFELVAEKAKKMSPLEFRLSLVKAGIIDTNGKLTAHYAKAKKK